MKKNYLAEILVEFIVGGISSVAMYGIGKGVKAAKAKLDEKKKVPEKEPGEAEA